MDVTAFRIYVKFDGKTHYDMKSMLHFSSAPELAATGGKEAKTLSSKRNSGHCVTSWYHSISIHSTLVVKVEHFVYCLKQGLKVEDLPGPQPLPNLQIMTLPLGRLMT